MHVDFRKIKIANFRYDTGVVSGAMLLIEKDDRIKPDTLWKELIVASTVGTAGIFALVGGFFNEYFGRKPTILTARYVCTLIIIKRKNAKFSYLL